MKKMKTILGEYKYGNICKLICWNQMDGLFWIRIFGIGLIIKDTTKIHVLFSERNGYTKLIKIGKWILRYLPYDRINFNT